MNSKIHLSANWLKHVFQSYFALFRVQKADCGRKSIKLAALNLMENSEILEEIDEKYGRLN